MADLLLPALIKIVMQKATDTLVQQIAGIWGVDDQRERLKDMLLAVEAVLADAATQGASNPAVKNWMLKLKSAAYDADDVLDEFCYEELRRDAVKRGHKAVNNVSDLLSINNPALFRFKMSRKLKKVVGRIEILVADMDRFKFVQGQRVQVTNRIKSNSLVVESQILGRDKDKEKLLKLSFQGSDNADLTVVPVVGMGGLGKTTLAQLVYNHPKIKENFKLLLWVCVSEDFNMGQLIKSIIELDKGYCNVPIDNMELLQRRLHEVLGGKRYFLVLDDVWNENIDDWERLRAMLNCGDSGSVVVVTTRSDRVAFIMGTVETYNLGCLNEDSWSLFQKRAFSKGLKECKELVEIGQKMVRNCQGLPLAINTIGSLMSCKHEVREWLAILDESNTWEIGTAKGQVLPVLRLSYDHLPPYMQQCFAFCAVFPKDYEMNKEKLIQFWMANGFIPSSEPGSLEMKGNDIFNELCWRSFFQEVTQVRMWNTRFIHLFPRHSKEGYYSPMKCKMHDLMHDLARSIMRDECLTPFKLPTQQDISEVNVRHISMKRIPLDINKIIDCFPSIRSLITSNTYPRDVENIGFLEPNSLRILSLHVIKPIAKTVVTPKMMKHLRYLEIYYQLHITSLPEAISTLYLLQTLRLSLCWKLEKLPEGMRYMSRLRHLYIDSCDNLRSIPSGLGQLSFLQTLTKYIICSEDNNGIRELENLNLCGQLHIYNLRGVRSVLDAVKANLRAKQNLDDLALCWGLLNDYIDSHSKEKKSNAPEAMLCDPFEVLDALEPCNKLKVLQITLYGGYKFPTWVMEYHMLENLIEFSMIECRECSDLPPVEKLPFLRILRLRQMDKLTHLCNRALPTTAEGDVDTQIAFPSLKELFLIEMPSLCSWLEGEVEYETSLVFSQLKLLNITNCPKLTAMPIAPFLENLIVEGNTTLSHFATRLTTLQELTLMAENPSGSLFFQPMESLKVLRLTGYNSIESVGVNEVEVSVAVRKCEFLYLNSCSFVLSDIPSNASLGFWKCFTFIDSLRIIRCDSFVYWPEEELRSLNFLRNIHVFDCQNFLGAKLESPAGRSNTEVLPALRSILIMRCPSMVEVPKCSTSIRVLSIHDCMKLQCIPEWLGTMFALKYLEIEYCKILNSLPSNIEGLISLEKLKILDCPNLANLPDGMEGLKALKELKIQSCPKLRGLPEGLLQRLNNLDELWIEDCPYLERHFRKNRKYRDLISEIHFAVIRDSRKFGILSDLALSISPWKRLCYSSQSITN